MHGYLTLIKNLDDNIGRLMEYLRSSGLEKNTIVVFTSDHGELLGAHGFRGKARAYSESASIPVIMRWPGHINAGTETGYVHSSIDHLPTLCAIAGIEVPEPVDGRDVSALWTGDRLPKRDAVLMANYSAGSRKGLFITDYKEGTPSDPEEWRAVKTERYTYVKYMDGREELFDDVKDRYQINNLIHDGSFDPEIIEIMRGELQEKLSASHDRLFPGTHYASWWDERKMNLLRTAFDLE
jgi:arylsulfatase A-like enzyme